jgi:hypothetical protein
MARLPPTEKQYRQHSPKMLHSVRPLVRIQNKHEMISMSYCWNCRKIFYSQDRHERLCEHCRQQESLLQYVEKPNKPHTRGGGIK